MNMKLPDQQQHFLRIEYKYIIGGFSYGEIQFKFYVPCNDSVPSDKTIGESIYIPMQMFKKYGDGIVSIIFTETSAEEAIKKCEGTGDSRIHRLIQQLIEEDESATPETIMSRLMERLGSEESDDDSGEEQNDTDDEIKTDLFGKKGSAD